LVPLSSLHDVENWLNDDYKAAHYRKAIEELGQDAKNASVWKIEQYHRIASCSKSKVAKHTSENSNENQHDDKEN